MNAFDDVIGGAASRLACRAADRLRIYLERSRRTSLSREEGLVPLLSSRLLKIGAGLLICFDLCLRHYMRR